MQIQATLCWWGRVKFAVMCDLFCSRLKASLWLWNEEKQRKHWYYAFFLYIDLYLLILCQRWTPSSLCFSIVFLSQCYQCTSIYKIHFFMQSCTWVLINENRYSKAKSIGALQSLFIHRTFLSLRISTRVIIITPEMYAFLMLY